MYKWWILFLCILFSENIKSGVNVQANTKSRMEIVEIRVNFQYVLYVQLRFLRYAIYYTSSNRCIIVNCRFAITYRTF